MTEDTSAKQVAKGSYIAQAAEGAIAIVNIVQQALSVVEETEKSRSIAARRLAEGVRDYAQNLATIAKNTVASTGGPYKGLLAYRLSDTELFFGRDRAIDELMEHLQRGPLTIFHSESGAGKSSLLRAGISPYLLGDGHLPVYLRPYDVSPSLTIKRAFLPNLADTPELVEAPPRDFLRQVTDMLDSTTRLYLFLDQFEEFFSLLDNTTQANFVAELSDCLEDESLNVRWVLSLRTEFFGRLARFRPQIRNPFENDYRLNRLDLLEAKTVITEPAAHQGISFEPELVDTLLKDLHDEQSDKISPPQIQLVCSALYNTLQERQATDPDLRTITRQMYDEEGRAKAILRGHLNRVLRRDLRPRERDVARQLLIALVSSDQQRCRRTYNNLAATLNVHLTSAQSLNDLLDRLIESRLLNVEEDEQTGEPTYELAHDYLLAEIEIDPETQTRKAAEELLKQEVEAHQRHGTLLSTDKFDIINSQREFLVLDNDAAELLRLSQNARRRAQLQRISAIAVVVLIIVGAAAAIALIQASAANQRAIAAETAEAGATQARKAQVTAQFEATRALKAEATAQAEKEIAETERDRANEQYLLATSRQLAAQAISTAPSQIDLALLLSLTAIRINDSAETRSSLMSGLQTVPHLITFLSGHSFSISGIVFHPDGQTLASGDTLWDVSDPVKPQWLGQLSVAGTPSAFSPDGQILIYDGSGDTIILWDVSDPTTPKRLGEVPIPTGVLAFSPDLKLLAIGGSSINDVTDREGSIVLWDNSDPMNPQQLGEPWSFPEIVDVLTFSADGQFLASGGSGLNGAQNGSIFLWDVSDPLNPQQLGIPLTGYFDYIADLAFNPKKHILAASGRTIVPGGNRGIMLWEISDPSNPQPIGQPFQKFNISNRVTFSPDGQILASGDDDGNITLWDVSDPMNPQQMGQPLSGHRSRVSNLAFSPTNQKLLVSAGQERNVLLWDISDTTNLEALIKTESSGNPAWSLAYNPDRQMLVTGNVDGIYLWDVSDPTNLVLRKNFQGHDWVVSSVTFSPDGQYLASGSLDSTIILWDLIDSDNPRMLSQFSGNDAQVDQVTFNPDGRILASSSSNGVTFLWDVSNPTKPEQLTNSISGRVAFNPTGRILAAGEIDITLWDISDPTTPQALASLSGHTNRVNNITFNSNGEVLVSGGNDDSLIFWDVSEPTKPQRLGRPLRGQVSGVRSLAFNPDESILASGSFDNTIILWDVTDFKQPQKLGQSLAGHDSGVTGVVFSSDGKWLASSSFDNGNIIILWDTDLNSWKQRACHIANRNFTQAEIEQYIPEEFRSQFKEPVCPEVP